MSVFPEFHGPNVAYILELYERYQESPDLVDAETQAFFKNWEPLLSANGGAASMGTVSARDLEKIAGARAYAQAIRQYGHLAAQLDPLGSPPPGDPELAPQTHGITPEELKELPSSIVGGPVAQTTSNAWEATEQLKAIYASYIGFDNDHIRIPEEREWLREAIESRRFAYDPAQDISLLERLTQIETFELFLQRTFPSKYRFSIEGLDMMVPILDEIVAGSVKTGTRTVAIAMAHRGRLNVLAHVMHKPYEQILADFKDPIKLQELQDAIGWTVGDVKYHKGERRSISSGDVSGVTLTMPPNPSHLEAINPIAVGMARAAGTDDGHAGAPVFDPKRTMQVLIHGDASFPGQGIVAETLNLSRLPGYWTGGTIHIIANNQLGFTTEPGDGRSTLYASDLAKGFKIPIIHVNADHPEACIEVTRIAFAFQRHFEKDILIDLIGYRRYGHNELDEPGFTQPKMYEVIRQHPTVRNKWAERLITQGKVDNDTPDQLVKQFTEKLQAASEAVDQAARNTTQMEAFQDPAPTPPPPGAASAVVTAIPHDRLKAINDELSAVIQDFKFYSRRLESTIRNRRKAFDDIDAAGIDWATAEELAFASILEDGVPIRLTGQDTERGTFSHRHAVLADAETGKKLTPLQQIRQASAPFEIHDSPLSEAAVLGFEFGYNVQEPGRLVLWEAQYGDFANGAQTIIDEFIVSAREKWGQTPSLVMLLPHGHEGAGPDHSSARPERFLSSAAKINLRLANCTSAAQYFHLLRRQALLLQTDPLPLVIMTPKSLLRHPRTASTARELIEGQWQPVIDDAVVDPEQVDRLVFCSGKFYIDLIESEHRNNYPNVALVRVEQLYPFPAQAIERVIARYPNVKQIVWAQEEPKNMGAWEFMNYRIKKLVGIKLPVNYVGRRRSSSPAEGSKSAHQVNQSMIIEYAFNWKFR